jgi:hypothetical protein
VREELINARGIIITGGALEGLGAKLTAEYETRDKAEFDVSLFLRTSRR